LQHLKAQGQRYCYARFEEHPQAAAVLPLMCQLRAAGDSYEAIATHLNMVGIPATLGGRWFANAVRKILLRTAPTRERRIA